MANWKEKGYVPDSDSDADSQDFADVDLLTTTNRNTHHADLDAHKTNGKEGCGTRTEPELNLEKNSSSSAHGSLPCPSGLKKRDRKESDYPVLETARTWRKKLTPDPSTEGGLPIEAASGEHSPQQNVDYTSRFSSPLSEVPSTLPDLNDLLPASPGQTTYQNLTLETCSPNHIARLMRISEYDDRLHHDPGDVQYLHKSGRTLRHRNAIQLHPYVIEKENFNQTWRSRGLKPVHILQEEAARAREEEENSQEFELPDYRDFTRSPIHRTGELPSSRASLQDDTHSVRFDDELPDVDTLLHHTVIDTTTGSYKRRKMNFKSRDPPATSTSHQNSSHVADLFESDRDHTISDVPPSPLLSLKRQSLQNVGNTKEPRFRVPPRTKDSCLPTPIPSSDPPHGQSRDLLHDIEKRSETASSVQSTVHEASSAESSSDEEAVTSQLKDAKRRIKGVLPASWLKLDLISKKRRTPGHPRHAPSSPPRVSSEKRGVARPIANSGSKKSNFPPLRRKISNISDNDVFDSDALDVSSSVANQNTSPFVNRMGEAIENDSIDAMLPQFRRATMEADLPRSRKRNMGLFGDQRQQTSTELGRSLTTQRRTTAQARKNRRDSVLRPSRLGVLDLSGQHKIQSTILPSFMKIAMRTARSRHDQRRHSPSRKYLHMTTQEETEDLNDTMSKWREGTLAPMQKFDIQRRQPLRPRSANNALPFNSRRSSTIPKQTKTGIKAKKSVQINLASSRPKDLQPSLTYLIRRRVRQPKISLDASKKRSNLLGREGDGGKICVGKQSLDDARPAILELSQSRQNEQLLQSAFSNGLAIFSKPDSSRRNSTSVLTRFLHADDQYATPDQGNTLCNSGPPQPHAPKLNLVGNQKVRKRFPERMDAVIVGSRRLKSPKNLKKFCHKDNHLDICEVGHGNRVQGFGSYRTKYSTEFDVTPLPPGVRFHRDTYLGSGEFAKSLNSRTSCDLDSPRGPTTIANSRKVYEWGAWNEFVAAEIAEVFENVLEDFENSANSDVEHGDSTPLDSIGLLKAVIFYFSHHLSFADPIDRVSFLQRCERLLSTFWKGISKSVTTVTERGMPSSTKLQSGVRIPTLGLVLAAHVHQVSEHCMVPSDLRGKIRDLVVNGVEQTLALANNGLADFEQLQAMSRKNFSAGPALHIDNPVIEALVITYHVMRQADIRSPDLLETVLIRASVNMKHFALREHLWHKCFTLLPFFEFDEHGALDVGRRFKEHISGWSIIKRLISPVLEMYVKNPRGQASSFNEYCRSLFSRCLHLINGWGWYRCDSIIGLLFDFFAQNNLAHLKNEECHGSPPFLENLNRNPALDASPEDRCFHLLLKIIGSGLKHLQSFYPSKKIRDLVWRLMPNHGRSHPKEQPIQQQDLDALRNHHDLLSTLYWATPPGFRPSLNAIRTLVDLEQSHREACHISIRTWFNLVKFQLSTNEPLEHILPFTQWHSDFLQHMFRQHNRARSEAEDQVKSAQNVRGLSISKDVLESTIAQNQKQVEAMLDDALVCLELAVIAAKTREAARLLLSSNFARILNGPEQLANGIILKALNVLLAYAGRCSNKNQQASCNGDNDDSQDYGDWSAFNGEDVLSGEPVEKASAPLIQMMGPLRTLLSNSFGADTAPQENMLLKLVDTWVAVSWILIEDGIRSCDDYLASFGKDNWSTLRDTEQTRKYAPYFYSVFIETDTQILRGNRFSIWACWLGSLVQSEASLKFQHNLMSSLLNTNLEEPLLNNLPFWANNSTARFNITAIEFSERRLSLISSVLSNMRTSLEMAYLDVGTNVVQIKQEYKDLLRHIMMTMRQIYTAFAQDSSAKASYVNFVHHVVEYFQEHTTGICPVDRFFTDGSTFPSPNYDPNYIVGQLKNYGLRLSDSKTPKELAVFLQSVSERAAAEGHQTELIEHLHGAISFSHQQGFAHSQLLIFVTAVIVPAYLQVTFESSVGLALAIPFLKAYQKIFAAIHLGLDGSNVVAVDEVTAAITRFLDSVHTAILPLIDRSANFAKLNVLTTLTSCFESVTAVLPTLDYALRLRSQRLESAASNHVEFLKRFSTFAYTKIVLKEDIECTSIDVAGAQCSKDKRHCDAFDFTLRELRSKLRNDWILAGDNYFVTQGSNRRQITIRSGQGDDERDSLRLALHEFGTRISTLPALGGWPEWYDVGRRGRERMKDDLLMF